MLLRRLATRGAPSASRVLRAPPLLAARCALSTLNPLVNGDASPPTSALPPLEEGARQPESGDVLFQVRGIESHLPEPVWQALARVNMSQGELNQLEVQEKIKRWQRFEGDTGSAEVVIGILTARIEQHARHMQAHHKDYHVKRRLIILLSKRNKVLKYLRRDNRATYEKVLEVEGIRPTGAFDPNYRMRPTKRPTRRGLVEARKRSQKKAAQLAKNQQQKKKKYT